MSEEAAVPGLFGPRKHLGPLQERRCWVRTSEPPQAVRETTSAPLEEACLVRYHLAEEKTGMKAAVGIVAAALLFASGCAQTDWIDRTLVTADVTGVWRGSFSSSGAGVYAGNRPVVLTLTQNGPKVTGQITMGSQSEGPLGPIEGTVSGDIFSFHDSRNRLTGRLQVNGDEMTGPGSMAGFSSNVTLHREP